MITLNSTVKEYVEETNLVKVEVTDAQTKLYEKMKEDFEVVEDERLTSMIEKIIFSDSKGSSFKLIETDILKKIEVNKELQYYDVVFNEKLKQAPKVVIIKFGDIVSNDTYLAKGIEIAFLNTGTLTATDLGSDDILSSNPNAIVIINNSISETGFKIGFRLGTNTKVSGTSFLEVKSVYIA